MEIFNRYKSYLERIDQSLLNSIPAQLPSTLKEPMLYFLSHPSKKLRPLLTILSCEALGGRMADALPAATAVELFHDFTLIHDDIMDEDELRRGKPTIHVKWDSGTAIMVGDALIGLAYQQLMKSPSRFLSSIVEMFSEALVIVCEGQALDKAFETSGRVNMTEYLAMISKKTAWLFKTACGIGAVLGGASPREIELLSQFGNNLGLAFQIQDDLLDFTADESKLGKKVGSDFKMDKKTYITLKYEEIIQRDSRFREKYPAREQDFASFKEFRSAIRELGVEAEVEKDVQNFLEKSRSQLQQINRIDATCPLYEISEELHYRQY